MNDEEFITKGFADGRSTLSGTQVWVMPAGVGSMVAPGNMEMGDFITRVPVHVCSCCKQNIDDLNDCYASKEDDGTIKYKCKSCYFGSHIPTCEVDK